MNRSNGTLVLMVCVLLALPALAQEWQADRNQITIGLGYFTPQSSGADNLSLHSSTAFAVDYRYLFAEYWALGFDYQFTQMDAESRLPYPPYFDVTRSVPLHSMTGLVQFRFPTGSAVQPYLGAGLNFMGTLTDSHEDLYPTSGPSYLRVTPKSDLNWGAMFQAGLDWRLRSYWVLNFDVRYVSNDLSMDRWEWSSGGFVRAGDYKLRVNPMVYSVRFGWRW